MVMKQTVKPKKLKRRREKLRWGFQKLQMGAEDFQNKMSEQIRDTKDNNMSIQGSWKIFRTAVLEIAKAEVTYKTATAARKPWVTDDMIRKLDEK